MYSLLDKTWFKVLVAVILISLLIFLLAKIDFIFDPLWATIGAVGVPIIGAGILFYVTRPIMYFLEQYKFPRLLAILTVYLILILIGFIISKFIAPIAQEQFSRLIDNLPKMMESAQDFIVYWQTNQSLLPAQVTETINPDNIMENIEKYSESVTTAIINFISYLVSFVIALVLVPFFLFFMLKDGEKLVPFIRQYLNKRVGDSFTRLASSVDHTLQAFIQGQLIVSFFVGVLLFIGYAIISLQYSLTLALFGMVTNVIPFVGPFLAVIPAILVALFQDPIMAVYVAIIMLVAQQIESNLISPNVMGKALSIHPLTIITIILAAGSIAGFLGILFAIPVYAVFKTIVHHLYQEWLASKEKQYTE
ncbi:AI-2E family transporter [Thalassobacillus devorans]|uniref:AI-2E family transporter n=1 Tax=Thalassobacillus devorans TaxID=279813 RepID=UPI00280BF600|nr:AI-2E family transporter [Thalassobacillus devorans]